MSQENVDALRRAFERFLAGSSDFGGELVDPDVVWDASEMVAPGLSGVYHGREGVAQFWREWLAAWESVEFRFELVDAGDSVVALFDQRMRGRTSGIEIDFGRYAHVYTFRDGLIVHWKLYRDQDAALEAAGAAG